LVWPTSYGFIMLVMLLYPTGWAMARTSERVGGWIAIGCLLAWLGTITLAARGIPPGETVLLGNLPKYMWRSFYALVFISGGYFGLCRSNNKTSVTPWLITVGLAGILYVVLKFAYYKTGGFESVSVAVVAGGLQGLVLLMVIGLLNLIPTMNATLGAIGLERPLAWLGRSSLQVYLSHMWFARPLAHWDMAWPVKVGVFFLLALATAVLIRWLIDYVVKYLTEKSRDKRMRQADKIS
jgi:fucose 4-O-acetylase-like acetyltransferase